jgi:hypothetical protein
MNPHISHSHYRIKRTPGIRSRNRKDSAQQNSLRMAIANNPAIILMLLSLFMFALLGANWQINAIPFNIKEFTFGQGKNVTLIEAKRIANDNRHINHKLTLGGVQLGMTQQMVQNINTKAQPGLDRSGKPVLTLPTANGTLVAWLFNDHDILNVDGQPMRFDARRVYRLRLDQAFANLSEKEIIQQYARAYGRPIEATCSRSGLGDTPRCTYNWFGGNGIALEAIAKKKIDLNGRGYTQLTTIATNTATNPSASKPSAKVVALSSLATPKRPPIPN